MSKPVEVDASSDWVGRQFAVAVRSLRLKPLDHKDPVGEITITCRPGYRYVVEIMGTVRDPDLAAVESLKVRP